MTNTDGWMGGRRDVDLGDDWVWSQEALVHRAKCNRAARRGEYSDAMETRNQ